MREDINLNEIGLEELILVTGSFIFTGHKLEDVDTDVIMKLMELAEDDKFMALLQEKSELKDRIRELEDEKNDNPYQKLIFVAQAVDSWRIIPRTFLGVYVYLLYYTTFWFMSLPDPSFEQSGLISIVVGAGAAWFGLYTNLSKAKGDFSKGGK